MKMVRVICMLCFSCGASVALAQVSSSRAASPDQDRSGRKGSGRRSRISIRYHNPFARGG